MLLRNHGTLALGSTVPECFMRLYYLERACAIQVKALAGGGLHLPSQQSIDTTYQLGKMPGAVTYLASLAWPALRRMPRHQRGVQLAKPHPRLNGGGQIAVPMRDEAVQPRCRDHEIDSRRRPSP